MSEAILLSNQPIKPNKLAAMLWKQTAEDKCECIALHGSRVRTTLKHSATDQNEGDVTREAATRLVTIKGRNFGEGLQGNDVTFRMLLTKL